MSVQHPIPEVRTDLLCRRCGYNLRTLPHDKACPECGTLVEWSVKGWKLRYANPQWVMQLKRGADAMMAAGCFLLGLITMSYMMAMPRGNDSLFYLALICAQLTLLLMLRAVWLLTAPEPFVETEKPHAFRRFVRGTGATLLTVAVLLLAKHQVPFELAIALHNVLPLSPWLIFPTSFFVLILLLKHVGSITSRMPESEVDRSVKTLITVFVVGLLVVVPGVIFVSMLGGMGGAMISIFCVLPVVFISMSVVLVKVFHGLARDLHYLAFVERELPWP